MTDNELNEALCHQAKLVHIRNETTARLRANWPAIHQALALRFHGHKLGAIISQVYRGEYVIVSNNGKDPT